MVFIEFTSIAKPPIFFYFVGDTLADVLADTAQGTHFGGEDFFSHREVNELAVKNLDRQTVEYGVRSILDGHSKSFLLGIVDHALVGHPE